MARALGRTFFGKPLPRWGGTARKVSGNSGHALWPWRGFVPLGRGGKGKKLLQKAQQLFI